MLVTRGLGLSSQRDLSLPTFGLGGWFVVEVQRNEFATVKLVVKQRRVEQEAF